MATHQMYLGANLHSNDSVSTMAAAADKGEN
jgi:hypothetical protein